MFGRQLVAAPVRLVAWVNGFIQIIDRRKLAEIVWFLTREANDGANVISLTSATKGVQEARQRGEEIFSLRPAEQVAAAMGWIEAGQCRDLPAALRWVERSREAGCEDSYSILQLELFLSEHLEGCDHVAVIDRILIRNDLPGSVTRDALLGRARMHLKQQQWDEAGEIAEKILRIEENGSARWVRWVIRIAAGEMENARIQIELAGRKIRPEVLRGLVTLGWLCLGEDSRALEVLQKCRREGKDVAIVDSDLAVFLRMNEQRIAESQAE